MSSCSTPMLFFYADYGIVKIFNANHIAKNS
jgi:hypothetical protein